MLLETDYHGLVVKSGRTANSRKGVTMTNLFRFQFDLFDGEGGDGASTGGDGLGEDARAFLASLGGDEGNDGAGNPSATEPTVVYGKDAKEEPGPDPAGGDEGADNQDSEGKSDAEEFAELIGKGGRFHDLYGQKVSSAIQERFKNQADLKSTVDSYDAVMAPFYQRYGVKPGDLEGLKEAIAGDDDLYAAEAERLGLTPEQYRHNLQLEMEAARGRQLQKEYQQEQHRAQVFQEWDRQAAELQKDFPKFDLGQEIDANETFANLIDNGVSIRDAFLASHADDIFKGLQHQSTADARLDVVNNIQRKAARPPENGARNNAAVVRKPDPSTFTDEDMDRILQDVANGKTFTF